MELHQVPRRPGWRRAGALRTGHDSRQDRPRPSVTALETHTALREEHHAGTRRPAHSRHDPIRGRHLLHASARMAGRRRGEGGSAGQRRSGPRPRRQRRILRRLELQQAQRRHRPQEPPRPRPSARHAAELRRFRGELRPRRDGKARPRLRRDEGRQARHHLRPPQGFRPQRPVGRLQVLRHGRAIRRRRLLHHRRTRRPAPQTRPHHRRRRAPACKWPSPSPPPTSRSSTPARAR